MTSRPHSSDSVVNSNCAERGIAATLPASRRRNIGLGASRNMGIAAAPQRLLWFLFGGISVVTLALATPAVAVFSRGRELAADRTAATATGSPAALASALRTLEDGIAETPAEDLRAASSISSLSILPLDRPEADATAAATVGSAPRGDRAGRLQRWLFATHPSTERRLEVLADLEATEAA